MNTFSRIYAAAITFVAFFARDPVKDPASPTLASTPKGTIPQNDRIVPDVLDQLRAGDSPPIVETQDVTQLEATPADHV
jgi:hypothetical protein